MIAVVGAAGKIGYSTSFALRKAGVPVRAILRDATKTTQLTAIGCEVGLADLQDSAALSVEIAKADAVQIILPPPPQAEDAEGEMRRSIESLAEALEAARANRVLAISDYGAHVGEGVGMPYMFYLFEERLRQLKMDKVFLRSAEHMEGWVPFIPGAIATGVLPSLHHPVEAEFPTVSAPDVGLIAADLLRGASTGSGEQIVHVEGPRRYSTNDVATALSQLVRRPVIAQELPRSQWQEALRLGLSASTAQLVVDVYDAHNKGGLIDVEPNRGEVRHGTTELIDALRPLVSATLNKSN
jgi:NAD(P)H dehydrogenase (quinone)